MWWWGVSLIYTSPPTPSPRTINPLLLIEKWNTDNSQASPSLVYSPSQQSIIQSPQQIGTLLCPQLAGLEKKITTYLCLDSNSWGTLPSRPGQLQIRNSLISQGQEYPHEQQLGHREEIGAKFPLICSMLLNYNMALYQRGIWRMASQVAQW